MSDSFYSRLRNPTAVQTGTSCTISAGQFAKIDSTAGAYTATLVSAPADKTAAGVKLVASATPVNAVTVTCGGTDRFNLPGGPTTVPLKLLNQGVQLQYSSAAGVWDVHGDDLPLGGLDSRYATGQGQFPVMSFGADATGASDSTSAIAAAQAAAVAAGGGYVVFGPGTFKMGLVTIAGVTSGASFTVPPLVHFRFAGVGVTVLTPLAANQKLFAVQSGKYAAGVRFEGGFTVKAHTSGSTGPAIDLTSARQWVIESPSYLASGSGTYAQVIGLGTNTYACRITNPVCESQALGACFIGSIDNTAVVANSNMIENPLFEGNTAPHMIDAAGTVQLTITGGIIESNNTTSAIRLGWMTTVRNCYFEQGSATGISFSMNAAGVDNPSLGYDPGACWLENNIHANNPDTLTIPAGVHPDTTLIYTPAFGSAFNITDNTGTLITIGSGGIVTPAPTTLLNNASGGTNGTTVTTGNSGGASGNAFSSVVTGSGLTFDNTETVAPSALAYKLVASASLPSLTWNIPATMSGAATTSARAYVYIPGSAFNCSVISSSGLGYALRVGSGNWTLTATGAANQVGPAVSANTWYRAELQFAPGNGTCTARIYSLSGTLLSTLSASGGTTNTNSTVNFGPLNSATGTMWLAALGMSNGGWLGPVVPTDQVAADIQPLGTQAAGALGVPADAGHVHQMPTLDQVAAPAASVAMNSQKLTGLANGTAGSDAAAFGQIAAGLNYGGIFGDGSDGSATLDGTATMAWASRSGSVYTMTRDAYLTSLAISSGVTLVMAATATYRLFCAGTVANAGTISANGASASGTTQGAGLGSDSLAGSGAGGTPTTGAGGAGATAPGALIGAGVASSGGAGSGGAGGGRGGVNSNSVSPLRMTAVLGTGTVSALGALKQLGGASGGGAGGGDGTNKGGGGGAGGGVIGIAAHAVVNTGTISAAGGAGGTPPAGNCGGGGGGGGGLIWVATLAAWTAGTTAVAGGAAGTAAGSGSNGIAGGSGNVLNVIVQ